MPLEEEKIVTGGTSEGDDGEAGKDLTPEEKDFREFVGADSQEESHPSWDNKRFRSIYKRYKDSQRAVGEKDKDHELMREHNRKLMDSVDRLTKSAGSLIQAQAGKVDSQAKDEVDVMESALREMKTKRSTARREADWDQVDRLDEEIERHQDKIQSKKAEVVTKLREKVTERAAAPPADMKTVEEWAKKTPWYNADNDAYDPLMVMAAREMDTVLMGSPAWSGKPVLERLNHVQKKIEARFQYKGPNSGIGLTEGVGDRSSGDDNHDQPRNLNAEQKRVARLMFAELKPSEAEREYEKQLRLIETGRA